MREELAIWLIAGSATVVTVSSCTLDILLAARLSEIAILKPLTALLYASFTLQIIALGCLFYYCVIFFRVTSTKRIAWIDSSAGAGFNAVALAVTGVALIWLVCRSRDVPGEDKGICDGALAIWGLTLALHTSFFVLLSLRTRKVLRQRIPRVQINNFGIILPPVKDLAIGTRPSFCSRDTTLASSRPCTSASSRTYSLQSSTTKVGTSIRSKFKYGSAKSSLDLPAFPAGEATALGNAFDRYDTSSVHSDMRSTVLGSSPLPKSGLEPIPGSRPGSPEDADEATLPTSPKLQQRPRTPRKAQTSSHFEVTSSPPPTNSSSLKSSPPNFSRPTSRDRHQPAMSPTQVRQPRESVSMNDLIHPLFRPNSPSPPQILTRNTNVMASPLANQPITPRALSRLRSASDIRSSNIAGPMAMNSRGQWRVMPSIDDSPSRPRSKSHSSVIQRRPSTAGSDSTESTKLKRTDSIGSPGPSVIEEDELPPILPGFVLSAGSRSSLVAFGKRKSVKRSSAHLE